MTAHARKSESDRLYRAQPEPAPVGGRSAGASPYGALDMAGNVAEWVSDFYAAGYYAGSPGSNPPGPSSGTDHVDRGGW